MNWNFNQDEVNAAGDVPFASGMYAVANGALANNDLVVIDATDASGLPRATPADADALATTAGMVGICHGGGATAERVLVVPWKIVRDVDTSAAGAANDAVYVSATPGGWAAAQPAAPAEHRTIGTVLAVSATVGVVFLAPGYYLHYQKSNDDLTFGDNLADAMSFRQGAQFYQRFRTTNDEEAITLAPDGAATATVERSQLIFRTSATLPALTASGDLGGGPIYVRTATGAVSVAQANAGGLLDIRTGAGGASATAAIAGGAGGAIVAQSGDGGASTQTGAAGAGGAATVQAGAGGAHTAAGIAGAGGAGGALSLVAGAGGAQSFATGTGAAGAGGGVTVTAGAGAAQTGGAASGVGGAGGAFTMTAGAGGATDNTGASAAGAGGGLTMTLGAGGAASAGTGAGGAGGGFTVTAGAGGNSLGGANGVGGSIVLAPASAGAGAGTPASAGVVRIGGTAPMPLVTNGAYAALADAAATLSAAQHRSGLVSVAVGAADRIITTRTAAQLVADFPGVAVNTRVPLYLANLKAANTVTLAAGAGVTLAGLTAIVPAATGSLWWFVFDNVTGGVEAITAYRVS